MTDRRRFSTGALAKAIGRNRATIWRWIHDGVTIRGQRIKLAAVRIGARVEVTPEQYGEFCARQTAAIGDGAAPPLPLEVGAASPAAATAADSQALLAEAERRRARLAQIRLEARLRRRRSA